MREKDESLAKMERRDRKRDKRMTKDSSGQDNIYIDTFEDEEQEEKKTPQFVKIGVPICLITVVITICLISVLGLRQAPVIANGPVQNYNNTIDMVTRKCFFDIFLPLSTSQRSQKVQGNQQEAMLMSMKKILTFLRD